MHIKKILLVFSIQLGVLAGLWLATVFLLGSGTFSSFAAVLYLPPTPTPTPYVTPFYPTPVAPSPIGTAFPSGGSPLPIIPDPGICQAACDPQPCSASQTCSSGPNQGGSQCASGGSCGSNANCPALPGTCTSVRGDTTIGDCCGAGGCTCWTTGTLCCIAGPPSGSPAPSGAATPTPSPGASIPPGSPGPSSPPGPTPTPGPGPGPSPSPGSGTGAVLGTIFDADTGTCSALSPGIPGVQLTIQQLAGSGGSCNTTIGDTTNGSGAYGETMCAPGTYSVSITDAGSFLTTPALYCNGGTTTTISDGGTGTLSFGLTQSLGSWFQVENLPGRGGGNVYASGNVNNPISVGCTGACEPSLMVVGAGDDPGVVGYGGTTAYFGGGSVSSDPAKQWLANTSYDGRRYGYGFYFNQLGFRPTSPADYEGTGLDDVAQPVSKPDNAYLARGGTMRIKSPWVVGSSDVIVFLVEGDLSIENEISVTPGGFLAFLVTGNITIDPSVNSEDGLSAVEGVYVADGVIRTGVTDTKLIAEGTFVGWTGISLERAFASPIRNNSEPAEVFRYRPDLKLNVPSFLTRPTIEWKEVAP